MTEPVETAQEPKQATSAQMATLFGMQISWVVTAILFMAQADMLFEDVFPEALLSIAVPVGAVVTYMFARRWVLRANRPATWLFLVGLVGVVGYSLWLTFTAA